MNLMGMNRTKAKSHTSFFDLEKNLVNADSERWDNFKSFMTDLKEKLQREQDQSIIRYWDDVDQPEENTTLAWIDPVALATAKKNIESDREKKNTKCFHNLVKRKTPLYPTDLSVFDQLDKDMPNFKEVTEYYRGAFALNRSRPLKQFKAPRPVLLLGNPGIGKTHFAKRMAKLLGTSYRFLDANSINSGGVLSGYNASFKGADAGFIFKEMAKSETMSPIILMDEIDKLTSKGGHSPISVFHQLFEKENAETFYDEFVDVEFNASQIIYILTANDASNIAPSLLSRMNVFHINNPSVESMREISQDIYQSELGGSKMFKKTLSDVEIDKLVKYTPREVTQLIAKNIFAQASKNAEAKRARELIIDITPTEIKNRLGF